MPGAISGARTAVRAGAGRLANPSYGLLLVTGLAMTYLGGLSLATPWIAVSLVLYVVLVLGGLLVYTPTLREQLRLAEAGAIGTADYEALSNRGRIVGI